MRNRPGKLQRDDQRKALDLAKLIESNQLDKARELARQVREQEAERLARINAQK
jgi:hypothetical protein